MTLQDTIKQLEKMEKRRDELIAEGDKHSAEANKNPSSATVNVSRMLAIRAAAFAAGINEALPALRTAQAEIDRLKEALDAIACKDDEGANRHLELHGTYSLFDEPGSVQIARTALSTPEGEG